MKKILLLVLCVSFLFACEKEEDESDQFDYLMFGHFYGECLGEECIEIYKITDDTLFEANQDTYPTDDFYTGTFVGLPESLYQQINNLNLTVPQDLLDITETTIGIPDAYDQGGYYIELRSGNTHRMWKIDTNYDVVPDGIHGFLDDIQEAISLLP